MCCLLLTMGIIPWTLQINIILFRIFANFQQSHTLNTMQYMRSETQRSHSITCLPHFLAPCSSDPYIPVSQGNGLGLSIIFTFLLSLPLSARGTGIGSASNSTYDIHTLTCLLSAISCSYNPHLVSRSPSSISKSI